MKRAGLRVRTTVRAAGFGVNHARPLFETHTHLDPSSDVSFRMWLLDTTTDGAATRDDSGNCVAIAIRSPMPLIRCTMPTPCGVCWYCKRSVASADFNWERPF